MPPTFAPFDQRPATPVAHADAPDADAPPDGLFDAVIASYQRAGRAEVASGGGCPFAPSCSVYARRALHDHGPLALILILDRLVIREHVAAGAYYPAICVAHTTRLRDDVP